MLRKQPRAPLVPIIIAPNAARQRIKDGQFTDALLTYYSKMLNKSHLDMSRICQLCTNGFHGAVQFYCPVASPIMFSRISRILLLRRSRRITFLSRMTLSQ